MTEQKYPKIYATVISREGSVAIVETDTGEQTQISIANRTGYGHHDDIRPGLRIKLYQKPGEDFFRFRFVGS